MSEDHDSTPISELDESASLNANDEFIISTKDSNDVYSSKKVKLSTVHNSVPSPPAGIQGITVKEEGTALATDATSLNFVGSTVTASGTGAEKTITIAEPAGGGGGGGGGASWSTGWVAVGSVPGTRALTHSLGTTDLVFDVFAADDASGTNAARVESMYDGGSQGNVGAHIRVITNSQFWLQLGSGYNVWAGSPISSSWANKFFKVVATASGGGGGGGSGMKYSGAEGTVQLTANNQWSDLNLSSHVGSNRAYVMMTVWSMGGQPATEFTIKPKDLVLFPGYPGDAGSRGTIGAHLLGDGSGAIVSTITDENGFVSVQGNIGSTTNIDWKILCYQVLS